MTPAPRPPDEKRTTAKIGNTLFEGSDCENCDTTYAYCTELVLRKKSPRACCGTCGHMDTHDVKPHVAPRPPDEARVCDAALSIKGEHFPCDWPTGENGRHDGWAHSNRDAEAIWQGDTRLLATAKREALLDAADAIDFEDGSQSGVLSSDLLAALRDDTEGGGV